MTRLLLLHFAGGVLFAAFGLFAVATDWAPSSTRSETVPVSVRENPSSYKPSYVLFTGWRPVPTSGGGGYSSGK